MGGGGVSNYLPSISIYYTPVPKNYDLDSNEHGKGGRGQQRTALFDIATHSQTLFDTVALKH